MKKIDLGFAISDASYPVLRAGEGELIVSFTTSQGQSASVLFSGVAAFAWQEADDILSPDEPWDGAAELFDTELLSSHAPGKTMHSTKELRHIRLHFNESGRLDALRTSFSASASLCVQADRRGSVSLRPTAVGRRRLNAALERAYQEHSFGSCHRVRGNSWRVVFISVARVDNQRYAPLQHSHFLGFAMQDFSASSHRSNYAFKSTADDVCRVNQPLPCGGGLTRC